MPAGICKPPLNSGQHSELEISRRTNRGCGGMIGDNDTVITKYIFVFQLAVFPLCFFYFLYYTNLQLYLIYFFISTTDEFTEFIL